MRFIFLSSTHAKSRTHWCSRKEARTIVGNLHFAYLKSNSYLLKELYSTMRISVFLNTIWVRVLDSNIYILNTILGLCTMQEPSHLGMIVLVSIWFRMVSTQIITHVYKVSLTVTYPSSTNLFLNYNLSPLVLPLSTQYYMLADDVRLSKSIFKTNRICAQNEWKCSIIQYIPW